MENNYDYTQIEQFVKDELEGVELRSFKEKLSQDKNLKEEVDFYKQLAEVTSLNGVFEEAELEIAEEQKEKEGAPIVSKKETKVFSLSRNVLSMAASFLIVVLAGWWMFTAENPSSNVYAELASDGFVHYPAQSSRGEEEDPTLYDNYKNKNYQAASSELENYAIAKKDATAQLYAAISYLALQQPQKAATSLEGLQGPESLNNRKYYYLGLAYLQLGQKEKALLSFKRVNEVDAFLYKKTTAILKELEQE